jgi:hypothetical protein
MQIQEFSEICVQFLAEGFEARCMQRGLLGSPKTRFGRMLAEIDHLLHISVQKIEFRTQIDFHNRLSSSARPRGRRA